MALRLLLPLIGNRENPASQRLVFPSILFVPSIPQEQIQIHRYFFHVVFVFVIVVRFKVKTGNLFWFLILSIDGQSMLLFSTDSTFCCLEKHGRVNWIDWLICSEAEVSPCLHLFHSSFYLFLFLFSRILFIFLQFYFYYSTI